MASSYLALMGITDFLGATSSGWLTDRFNNYNLLAIYYGFRGLSLVYLPYSSLDAFSLTLWACFSEFDFIATIPPTARLCAGFFGKIDGPIAFLGSLHPHQLGAAAAAGAEKRECNIELWADFCHSRNCMLHDYWVIRFFKSFGTKLAEE